jgi:hypothetical protein
MAPYGHVEDECEPRGAANSRLLSSAVAQLLVPVEGGVEQVPGQPLLCSFSLTN